MIKILLKKRASPKLLEAVILALMATFGVIAAYIFAHSLMLEDPSPFLVIVVVMILQIIAILGLTFIVLKVWEQHVIPEYVHKNAKMFFEEDKEYSPKKGKKKTKNTK